ncbi:MAG TPA: hypothetical protein DDZ76_12810 [Xanthomonadales bacterium]|nr:hypothetical protein [Xanthomonadales bacterium]
MTERPARIALLIDADNSPASKIDLILAEIARYGSANIRRAYGNWKSASLVPWEKVLHEYAIRPIQQFDYSKGKNASDIALIIDAMDLLYTQHIDAYCLVSSDSDFTPLVMRLRTSGAEVYGFGERKTPMPFVNACSRFIYLEGLSEPPTEGDDETAAASLPQPTAKTLRGDTRLVQLLRNAVEASAADDGWSHLGAVGNQIANQASFDPRNYGYKKLSELFGAIGLFDIRREDKVWFVRDKRSASR